MPVTLLADAATLTVVASPAIGCNSPGRLETGAPSLCIARCASLAVQELFHARA